MNSRVIRTVATLACLAGLTSLTACGSVPGLSDFGAYKHGTQVTAEQMGQVTDSKTTKAEVIALVGQPNRKSQLKDREVWYYDFTQIGQAVIGRNINETTAFEFNNKGILTAHYKTEGAATGSSSNPLLQAAGQ